jgi:hypothetical protein
MHKPSTHTLISTNSVSHAYKQTPLANQHKLTVMIRPFITPILLHIKGRLIHLAFGCMQGTGCFFFNKRLPHSVQDAGFQLNFNCVGVFNASNKISLIPLIRVISTAFGVLIEAAGTPSQGRLEKSRSRVVFN